MITFSIDCGIDELTFLILGNGSFRCFNAISTALSPLYGTKPESNSYIIIPIEYMSLLIVEPFPCACSGGK